ncbi:MAG: phosphoenolpyruvate synthase [Gammaproteobacteria bacterium]|nr:phosphoenolpyruvate synthase [Gammaproteobacteria bacterium]
MTTYVIGFDELGLSDVDRVGGKNASLGEMLRHLGGAGVRVPGGFATTAAAFREFLDAQGLARRISARLDHLDVDDLSALRAAGAEIRAAIVAADFPVAFTREVENAYARLQDSAGPGFAVAVRSSATAEDLPDASFAGQQETFLNVRGLDDVLRRMKEVFASLYTDRAIAYRVHQGYAHDQVALSVGVQQMVRSDLGASGVMFTLDTESGFRDTVFITAGYGLGETVVQGSVKPDEFYVYKPALAAGRPAVLTRTLGSKAIQMVIGADGVETRPVAEADSRRFCIDDADVEALARHAMVIERHYARPMDIEWAKDGLSGEIYIVQARPETVQSRASRILERYEMRVGGEVLTSGRSIGQKIGGGVARVIADLGDMDRLRPGDVLVTDMTDPDWEPVMKRAAAIVTNRGGRTCHAAIIARELGVPAVVGCGDATETIADGATVTVSCAEGDTGLVYRGAVDFKVRQVHLEAMPAPPVRIMMNVGNPERAFAFAALPHQGVGLARLEFIVARLIGIHPRALLEFDKLSADLRERITPRIAAYGSPVQFFERKLAEGVATIAAAFAPHPVIVRLSDFKSNEYANLLGGEQYEPREENPMLGFRGASRYLSEQFRECFEMECRALKFVRERMGLSNVEVMVPFVRTPEEAGEVIAALARNGLVRGENGLRLIMMCELPANAILAERFLVHFDGFSIGSNDLTQLTLGLDRDSGLVADRFDERNPAVKMLMAQAIAACREAGKYVGICGQGPSDHPDLARWLVEQGVDSISLNPDTVIATWLDLAEAHAGDRA